MTKFDQVQTHPSHAGQRDTGRAHAISGPALDMSEFVIPTTPKVRGQAEVNPGMARRQFHPSGEPVARTHPSDTGPTADQMLHDAKK